jgi:NAD(P)-dependent dehydrogenase (short-subunit alcohol dehydrogenase family)
MAGLQGRRVLVVGASAGIGRWSAVRCSQLGAEIVVAARRADQLAETCAMAGGGHMLTVDVRDPEQCARVVNDAVTMLGGLDAVLYTVGWSPLKELQAMSAEDWQAVFEINTIAPQLITAAALPPRAADGVVSFMSSDSVADPRHSLVAYAASKAALETCLKGWRTEVLGGVRFVKITVGPTIPTDFGREFDGETLGQAFGHWTRQGMKTGYMDVTDVGNAVGDQLALCFDYPGICSDEFVLRPVEPKVALSDFGSGSGAATS